MVGVLGQRDEHLRIVEDHFDTAVIHVRGNEITVDGPEAPMVGQVFSELVQVLEGGQRLGEAEVTRMIDMVKSDESPSEVLSTRILKAPNGRIIRAKSSGQKSYVEQVKKYCDLRHRSCWYRQDLVSGCAGRRSSHGQTSSSYRFDSSSG